jgi:hypothetical protein
MEITVPLKTKHPFGFSTARGRNGDFIAAKAIVSPVRGRDEETDEPIINLKVYSNRRGDAAPLFLCLGIREWLEIMSAIERVIWEINNDPSKGKGG